MFALHADALDAADQSELWERLESARRGAGIVQHHDSITGTMCVAEEGCAGTDQVVGAHNVLQDYEGACVRSHVDREQLSPRGLLPPLSLATVGQHLLFCFVLFRCFCGTEMLRNATANSREVSARVLSALQANAGSASIPAEHKVQASQPLSPQVSSAFGDVLMGNGDGGEDAIITV